MLLYLLIKRPMKKIVNLVQQIILEFILLPFNICVLILAILDETQLQAIAHRKNIGEVIVYINVIVPFLSIGLMVAKVLAIGFEFYKQRKAHQTNKLRKFSVELSRSNHTLNAPQEIFPCTTTNMALPSSSFINESPIRNHHRMFDMTGNMNDLSLSPEISIMSNSRSSPPLRYNSRSKSYFYLIIFKKFIGRTRSHHPDLILPDIPLPKPEISPRRGLGFDGARNFVPPQNERSKF